jgi:hypothetical protein
MGKRVPLNGFDFVEEWGKAEAQKVDTRCVAKGIRRTVNSTKI